MQQAADKNTTFIRELESRPSFAWAKHHSNPSPYWTKDWGSRDKCWEKWWNYFFSALRPISMAMQFKNYNLALLKQMILGHRCWRFRTQSLRALKYGGQKRNILSIICWIMPRLHVIIFNHSEIPSSVRVYKAYSTWKGVKVSKLVRHFLCQTQRFM